MKTNEEQEIHLGQNIKCLMRAFGLQQYQLANQAGLSDNQLSILLHKAEIDDEMLQKVAKGLGNGVTADLIKAYRHEDTVDFIINNYTQNVENGGKGTYIPSPENIQHIEEGGKGTYIPSPENIQHIEEGGTGTLIPTPTQTIEQGGTGTLIPEQDNSSVFEEGSQQTINNYVAEQAFEFLKEIAELKTEIMRLRMKYEPDAVESELKKKYKLC